MKENKKNVEALPEKTVERLCIYRNVLSEMHREGKVYVYAKELAEATCNSPVQVRRDIMSLNMTGTPQRGYLVRKMLKEISELIDPSGEMKVCLVGIGNLGKAVLTYFNRRRPMLSIVAAFDTDPAKAGRLLSGCPTYSMEEMPRIVTEKNIKLGIIAVPGSEAQNTANQLISSGVVGLVNFAHVLLKIPESAFLENLDITTALEKTAYFAKTRSPQTEV
jgi:redox-sensing transcriptional repressor